MSINSINEILNTEQQAEQMISAAKSQAQQKIAAAQNDAAAQISQLKKQAASIEERAILEYTKLAEAQIDIINKETCDICENLKQQANQNFEKAVKVIVDRVVNV